MGRWKGGKGIDILYQEPVFYNDILLRVIPLLVVLYYGVVDSTTILLSIIITYGY
jgi:hypothetical protein